MVLSIIYFIIVASCAQDDVNEGNGDIRYFSDKPKAEIPNGSCNVTHFQCQSNPSNVIRQFSATTPYDCCKACLNDTTCVSWTHWYQNASQDYTISDKPLCHLFKTYLNNTNSLTAGNCVTGIKYNEQQYGKRPNFIFYYPDTIRAELLSAYGYPLETTPNLDKFIKNEGVVFNNHIAQHSQCSPSRTAMITGRYMHCLGHRTQQHLTQYYEPNYYRWMKDSGYYVLWLGKNDALSKDTFPLSVNEWHHDIGVATGPNPYKYPQPGYYSFYTDATPTPGNSTKNGDYNAIVAVQQFLASNPPQPFTIFIPGKGGHPAYGAPDGYYDKFTAKQVEEVYKLRPYGTANKPKYHSPEIGIPYYRNLTSFNDSFFYDIHAIYLGRMYYMDWLFGELVNAMNEFDNKTNTKTSIFMSSDHGDFSGDYHMVEKWPGGLDDVLVHIPLIARVGESKLKNININMPTQSFDVLETQLDLANIQKEWNGFGISLKPQLLNGTDGDLNKYVYSEGGFYYHNELYPNGSDHINGGPSNDYYPRAQEEMSDNGNGSPRCSMIRNAFYKLVFRPLGLNEFYDLKQDPRQVTNIWGTAKQSQYQIVINEMMNNLTAWYVLTGDLTPILMDPRGVPGPAPALADHQTM